jgi:hypothetical protein
MYVYSAHFQLHISVHAYSWHCTNCRSYLASKEKRGLSCMVAVRYTVCVQNNPPIWTHRFNELAKKTRVLKAFIEVTMTRWVPPVETKQYKMNEKSPCIETHENNCTIQNDSLIEINTFTARPRHSSGVVMWDLWWTKWHWSRCSLSTLFSPANLQSTNVSTITTTYHPGLVQ